jgi:hypothetical protein
MVEENLSSEKGPKEKIIWYNTIQYNVIKFNSFVRMCVNSEVYVGGKPKYIH